MLGGNVPVFDAVFVLAVSAEVGDERRVRFAAVEVTQISMNTYQ